MLFACTSPLLVASNSNNYFLSFIFLVQVGRRISVCITRIDEEKNDLIISEREAWVSFNIEFTMMFFV